MPALGVGVRAIRFRNLTPMRWDDKDGEGKSMRNMADIECHECHECYEGSTD